MSYTSLFNIGCLATLQPMEQTVSLDMKGRRRMQIVYHVKTSS